MGGVINVMCHYVIVELYGMAVSIQIGNFSGHLTNIRGSFQGVDA